MVNQRNGHGSTTRSMHHAVFITVTLMIGEPLMPATVVEKGRGCTRGEEVCIAI